jgi:hypothetical protein
MRHYRTYLILIIMAGALLRLQFLVSSQWLVEGDEAAVGLQALHILRGERPIFYPGQSYLGNFESYLVALSLSLFRDPQFSIKVVPLIFALSFIFLCASIGTELIGDPKAGLAAALTAAIPSVYLVMWSLKARGGFIEALVVGQLAILWMFRWLKKLRSAGIQNHRVIRPAIASGAIFGFLCGYGIWMNPLVVYFFLPMGAIITVFMLRIARLWRLNILPILSSLMGVSIGILPLILYRFFNGHEVFSRIESKVPPTNEWLQFTKRAWLYLWQDGLPALLGLRLPRQAFILDWRMVVIPLYVMAVLYLFWRARISSSIMAFALVMIVAFPIFDFGSLTGGNAAVIIPDSGLLTRYLIPLYLPLSIALGLVLARMSNPLRTISILVLVTVNLYSIFSANVVTLAQNEFSNQPLPLSDQELIYFLQAHSLTYVFTNHWIGYPVMLESRERILTFDYPDVQFGMDRFPDYSEQVVRAEHPAFVLFNPHYPSNPIDDELARLNISYHKWELQNYIVYSDFAPYFHPSMLESVLKWPYY